MNTSGIKNLSKAIVMATNAHSTQKRKASGDPYIIHPLRVMNILIDAGFLDEEILIAAVLHDTVEDTNMTIETISTIFGYQVGCIVNEVTNDPRISKADQKRMQVIKAKNMSCKATLVKKADMIDNLKDLCNAIPPGWTKQRFQGYFIWKKEVLDNFPQQDKLSDIINDIFKRYVMFEGVLIPVLPEGDNSERLEAYYASLY